MSGVPGTNTYYLQHVRKLNVITLRVGKSVSYGDTLPHTVVGVCGEFQRTGRFL